MPPGAGPRSDADRPCGAATRTDILDIMTLLRIVADRLDGRTEMCFDQASQAVYVALQEMQECLAG
jgi:hypothetical protein